MRFSRLLARSHALVVAIMAISCGPVAGAGGDGSSSSGGSTTGATTVANTSTTTVESTSTTAADASGGESESEATTLVNAGSSGDSSGSSSGGWDCTVPPTCNGDVWDCSDGVDNDGDGAIDLGDLECTGPCDSSETSFYAASFAEEGCAQDCYFDGNSGSGDDLCIWKVQCDPEEPLAGCNYNPPTIGCDDQPVVPPECLAFCVPFVPNGCDCFGCCTFTTNHGPETLYLLDFDCALTDGLDGCSPCTQNLEACGNPCEVEACELCIGQTELPPGCAEVGCADALACTDACDCGPYEFCLLGCCTAIPPS